MVVNSQLLPLEIFVPKKIVNGIRWMRISLNYIYSFRLNVFNVDIVCFSEINVISDFQVSHLFGRWRRFSSSSWDVRKNSICTKYTILPNDPFVSWRDRQMNTRNAYPHEGYCYEQTGKTDFTFYKLLPTEVDCNVFGRTGQLNVVLTYMRAGILTASFRLSSSPVAYIWKNMRRKSIRRHILIYVAR